MNTYFRSIYYGIAVALGFIGLFGLAIDDNQVSVWLIIVSITMAVMTYGMREYDE